MMTDYKCEQCGKFLFSSDKPRGGAGAEATRLGFVFKIPFLYGITTSHFFCSKECWNKWFLAHTTEEQRKKGNEANKHLKERLEADKPALLEGLQRIQAAFDKLKKKRYE